MNTHTQPHIQGGTPIARFENRLCGTGAMLQKDGWSKGQRLYIARAVHSMLKEFPDIDRKRVFSRFFSHGELSESDWKLTTK